MTRKKFTVDHTDAEDEVNFRIDTSLPDLALLRKWTGDVAGTPNVNLESVLSTARDLYFLIGGVEIECADHFMDE